MQLSPSDVLRLILSNWYWFVAAILLCLAGGWLYMHSTSPLFKRTATVLVKDSRKGSGAELTAFSDLMGGLGRRSVDNEVYIFESRRLMEQVVKRHNLTTRQTTKRGLRTVDLYGRQPVTVCFTDNNSNAKGEFTYTILDSNSLAISNFTNSDFEATVLLDDTISSPLGSVVFSATPHFETYRNGDVRVSLGTLNNTVEAYRKKLKCEITNKQASVITLTMMDVVPQRAEDVINGIIEVYNCDAIDDKRTISTLTEQFIDERLATLGQELNIADSDIAAFKRENELYSPVSQAMLLAEQMQELRHQELSLEANLEMAEYILDYTLSSPELNLIPASTVALGGASAALAAQIEEYNHSLLEYNRLVSKSSESNPSIVELKAQITAVRNTIIGSLKSHIDGLKLQINSVNREYKSADARLNKTPEKEKELLSKTRQQKVKEELYIYLLTKLEENALMGATAESNARVIDFAYGADKPVSPRSIIVYVFALMMGCIVPFVVLYLREVLNTSVRSRRDVKEVVTAPFLGEIPLVERPREGLVQIREDGRDALSESFRMIRTNLGFMSVDQEIKTIMLTSSVPHSGKSFVATNLASILATGSKRVLLVDMDLRRRTLSKSLGQRNNRRGLSTYLSGKFDNISDAITTLDAEPRLDILCAGPQPPNPAELLISKSLDTLIEALRVKYDYIIIDSVPAMAVADAIITDRVADLTIYVIREGKLDRRQLPDIEELHQSRKLSNMCVILNGTTISKHSYGYGYSIEEEASVWKRFTNLFKKQK